MFKYIARCPPPLRWRIAHSSPPLISISSLRNAIAHAKVPQPIQISNARTLHSSRIYSQAEGVVARSKTEDASSKDFDVANGPATRFAELSKRGLVDGVVIDTITKKMGLETMTQVQSLTLNEALKNKDVLAQARTGTGKTIGFLLPVLQNIINSDPSLVKKKHNRNRDSYAGANIRALIISPTRELAEQIATEARKLTQDTGVVVQTAVGGTQKRYHLMMIQREGCHILVGTPGRIKDIFSDRSTRVAAPNLDALVLDEADRLMDDGFWPEIQAIQDLLPPISQKDRQTLLYSATIPNEVVRLARTVMKPDLHYVRTVQEDEQPTAERVEQYLAVVPSLENQLPTLLEICDREIKASLESENARPFKAIVYFNATAETRLAAEIFIKHRTNEQSEPENIIFGNTRMFELHGRLTQGQRTKAADNFREAKSAILLSSDVTARGMDFPNVTHVIQVGLAPQRDTYIHRLGRTARAGAEGEGWLILPKPALNEARIRLGKIPLKRDSTLETPKVDFSLVEPGTEPEMSSSAQRYFDIVRSAARRLSDKISFDDSYMSMIGTFQWLKDKVKMVEMMNRVATVIWGLKQPPEVSYRIANKMGLVRIPGLRIGKGERKERDNDFQSGHRRDSERTSNFQSGQRRDSERSNDFQSGYRRDFERNNDFQSGRRRDSERNSFSQRGKRGQSDWTKPTERTGRRNFER